MTFRRQTFTAILLALLGTLWLTGAPARSDASVPCAVNVLQGDSLLVPTPGDPFAGARAAGAETVLPYPAEARRSVLPPADAAAPLPPALALPSTRSPPPR